MTKEIPPTAPPPGSELVAFRSTRGEGVHAKPRWTELSLHFCPNAGRGQVWQARSTGRSTVDGETDREQVLCTTTMKEALDFFGDESAPARSIWHQASAWAATNAARIAAAGIPEELDDRATLKRIYGDRMDLRGFWAALAEDMGVGESSIRMAIRNGTGIRVPLASVARFLNVEALRAHSATARLEERADG